MQSRFDGSPRPLMGMFPVAGPTSAEFSGGVPLLERRFVPLNTHPSLAIYTLVLLAYCTLVAWNPVLWPKNKRLDFNVKASLNVVTILASAALEHNLHQKHKLHQSKGYLMFYRHTRGLLRLPFTITSVCTVALLLALLFRDSLHVPQERALQGAVAAEALAILVTLAVYVWRVRAHNNEGAVPDALAAMDDSLPEPEPFYFEGHWRQAEGTDSIVEQQAELIVFLQERMERLNAARDADFGALLAERDNLQADVRAARQSLADRDAHLRAFQMTQAHHVEENSRMRAVLEEWSSRCARLERRLGELGGGGGGGGGGRSPQTPQGQQRAAGGASPGVVGTTPGSGARGMG